MPAQNTVENVQYADLSDALLAAYSLNGTQEAFATLVERYQASIFTYVYRLVNDHDLACDLFQQVFLRLYTSLPQLETTKPFKSWLFRVAHNLCIDEFRRRRHVITFSQLELTQEASEESVLYEIVDPRSLPEEVAELHDTQAQLLQAIASLPIKFRTILMLRYTSELSFAEIGKILQMPEPTAKTYFHRGKALLRTKMQAFMSC